MSSNFTHVSVYHPLKPIAKRTSEAARAYLASSFVALLLLSGSVAAHAATAGGKVLRSSAESQQLEQESNPQSSAEKPSVVRPRTVAPKPAGSTTTETPEPQTRNQVSETIDEDDVVSVDSNLVLIPASVVDTRGRAISDLRLDDFELRVDGEVKPVRDLSRAETPVLIALLFDNSASLSSARAFEKQAATRFFQSVVRKIDRAAVYSISTVPTLSQGLTSNVKRLVDTIEGFPQPEGATALFDGIAQAADYLQPFNGRKVIVLVSDGTDTVSDLSFEAALNRVLRSDAQVYVIQTRQVEDPNLHDPVSEGLITKLTEQTGGAVYVPQSVEDLDSAFSQIALDIGQQYLLSYYPYEDRQDKYFRFITLKVKTRAGLRVRARKGYYPNRGKSGSLASAVPGVPQFSVTAPSPHPIRSAEAHKPIESGIVVSRKSVEESNGRKIGPAGPDDDDLSPKRTVITSTAIPENAPTVETVEKPRAIPSLPRQSSPSQNSTSDDVEPQSRATVPVVSVSKVDSLAQTNVGGPISGGVLNSRALVLPKPNYPDAARTAGAWGKVVVQVNVGSDGSVHKAKAISGHPLLQRAAVLAALQAKFSPELVPITATGVHGTLHYEFKTR